MDASGPATSLRWVGDRHLLVSVDAAAPTPHALDRLRSLPGVIDVVPAETTALLTFDAMTLDPVAAIPAVRRAIDAADNAATIHHVRTIEIPVCYAPPFAPDLEDTARRCGIGVEALIDLHSHASHTVRFLGFSPGFAYIAGLPTQLTVPRLDSPRIRVPAGSVGIAGDRTGIYPREGPGGWRLIGQTPLRMFDVDRDPPTLLRAGDRVRFVPIDEARFRSIEDGSRPWPA